MLNRLAAGDSLSVSIREAQNREIAEADPPAGPRGDDSATKPGCSPP